jgi:hypothetical protein
VAGGRYAIAVDWSGAMSPAVQRRKIWVASAVDGRLRTLSCGRTRSEAIDHVLDLLEVTPSAVVGLDFSFSFPSWWLDAQGVANGHGAWDLAASLGEEWLASCISPFWGRPGRTCELPPSLGYRRTELSLTPRPGSVFQIGGAGSVGTASLRGMPHLRRLEVAGVAVWPFEPWPSSSLAPVAAEVWPRLCIGPVVKSRAAARAAHLPATTGLFAQAVASDDAFDAACAAMALSSSRCFPPRVELDDVDRLEGRILLTG